MVARHLEVSEATYHWWRNQYGGLKADDAKRLKHFEGEKRRVEEDRGRQGAGDRRSAGGRRGTWCRIVGQASFHGTSHPQRSHTLNTRSGAVSMAGRFRQEASPLRIPPCPRHGASEGWVVNRKKIQRLWREEGLRVP